MPQWLCTGLVEAGLPAILIETRHLKTPMVQEIRALLTARKLRVAKLRDVESSLRGILRGFGLKVGAISKGQFEGRIRELGASQAMLERIAEPLLWAQAAACRIREPARRAAQGGARG